MAEDLPNRTPASAQGTTSSDPSTRQSVISDEERLDITSKPHADLTVDSEPDHARGAVDTQTMTAPPPEDDIQIASWEDVRKLPAAPPSNAGPGSGMAVFICVQHPRMIVMDPDTKGRIIGQFRDGYLATDDPKLISILSNTRRYVKRLDTSTSRS